MPSRVVLYSSGLSTGSRDRVMPAHDNVILSHGDG